MKKLERRCCVCLFKYCKKNCWKLWRRARLAPRHRPVTSPYQHIIKHRDTRLFAPPVAHLLTSTGVIHKPPHCPRLRARAPPLDSLYPEWAEPRAFFEPVRAFEVACRARLGCTLRGINIHSPVGGTFVPYRRWLSIRKSFTISMTGLGLFGVSGPSRIQPRSFKTGGLFESQQPVNVFKKNIYVRPNDVKQSIPHTWCVN